MPDRSFTFATGLSPLALRRIVWCVLAGLAIAGSPARAQPAPTPRPPDVLVAQPFNTSVSTDMSQRFRFAELTASVEKALVAQGLRAQVRTASPATNYAPPGDDDLSFATADDSKAIAARIATGFPALPAPLLLMTIAERGPYVIVAAHIFDPNDSSGKPLTRIARDVVEAGSMSAAVIGTEWPACIADAAKRFVKDNERDGIERECRKATQQANLQPAAKSVNVPIPTPRPAPPTKGMLDGVDVKEGETGILPGGTPRNPPAAATPPANTAPGIALPSITIAPTGGGPAIVVPPITIPIPGVKNDPPPTGQQKDARFPLDDKLRPSLSVPQGGSQFWEMIYANGFAWRPQDPTRVTPIVGALAARVESNADCAQNLGVISKALLEANIKDDLQKGLRGVTSRKELYPSYFELQVNPPRQVMVDPRVCMRRLETLPRIRYYVAPDTVEFAEASEIVDDLRRGDSEKKFPFRDWRLPTRLKSFAIGTAILHEPRLTAERIEFWTDPERDGQGGVLTVKPSQPQILDHSTDIKPGAKYRVIAVHNY